MAVLPLSGALAFLSEAAQWLDLVEIPPLVNRDRNKPTGNKNDDDEKAKRAKVVVEARDGLPKPSVPMELAGQHTESFDAAHCDGHDHGDTSNRHVVVKLAN